MAKFKFELQSLLRLKAQIEDNLKNELGKAIQKLEKEKEKLRKIQEERDECINQANGKAKHGIAVAKLRDYSSYISLLVDKIEQQKENINYAQNNVDRYREQVIKAMQEKKMLEGLKEKKIQEFQKDEIRAEQKLNDEVISFNINKQLAGEKNE